MQPKTQPDCYIRNAGTNSEDTKMTVMKIIIFLTVTCAGCVKYPVSTGVMDDCTELGMVASMTKAAATKHAVRGVKGPSPFLNVPGFYIVWRLNPDNMHCALPG